MSAAWGQEYLLTLSCPEKPGIVHAVSSYLVQHSANILASQQYGEAPDGRFFMRIHFAVPPGSQVGKLRRDFAQVAEAGQMSWQLHDAAARIRTLIMVSRLGHCLNDLLFRWKTGALPVNIVDLDEGPIIEQDVIRVDHSFPPERLAQAGRDVEAQVLARAVTWHGEHRVLLNGDRTVIFH
jgi:formyltetrahydrofolate hydrolase